MPDPLAYVQRSADANAATPGAARCREPDIYFVSG